MTTRELLATLTPREAEVLWLIYEGDANKVIAYKLSLSQRTVEIHRSRVMEKMQADSLAQLIRALCTMPPVSAWEAQSREFDAWKLRQAA